MKNLFFNLKLHLFLFSCSRPIFYVIIGFPTQKSTKVQIFMKIGLIEFKLDMTISLYMENSKWRISEKKALKLPKFQKLISQEPFRIK